MSAAGIIAEFNPFHLGHSNHLHHTRKITGRKGIVAVMSGNFVQRGEPALIDKWKRTKMALLAGVDIVIELPVPFVIAGADYFARAAVKLLASTAIVDVLSFGSECGNLGVIREAGKILAVEPPKFRDELRTGLTTGKSYAAAQKEALALCLQNVPDGLFTRPNNGLAIEYCKALELLGNPMEAVTTHRISGGPSATKIRKAFLQGEHVAGLMPDGMSGILYDAYAKGEFAVLDDFSQPFRYMLYRNDPKGMFSEGLDNRFRRFVGEHKQLSCLLSAVKTKRYTLTRLQRTAMSVILGIDKVDMDHFEACGGAQYIRVLGFRKEASGLLGDMSKKASLPIITHGAEIDKLLGEEGTASKMLAKELEAGDIYRLSTGAEGGFRSERGQGIVVV